jgi:hypothetical protein
LNEFDNNNNIIGGASIIIIMELVMDKLNVMIMLIEIGIHGLNQIVTIIGMS